MNNVTHEEAVKVLVAPCGNNKLTLLVAHENFLSGYTVVNLSKHESELWGISILGGIGYESANPYDAVDECVYITNILPFSPADLSQLLKSGQRIIEVRGAVICTSSKTFRQIDRFTIFNLFRKDSFTFFFGFAVTIIMINEQRRRVNVADDLMNELTRSLHSA